MVNNCSIVGTAPPDWPAADIFEEPVGGCGTMSGCGAMNAGWLDKCGKCNKKKKKLCVQVEIYTNAKKNGKTIG